MATIGPASSSRERLVALARAGMDAARLNFSHGSREEQAERARLVREVQQEIGRPLAVIADLQGPKLRIGDLPNPVVLPTGGEAVVSFGNSPRDGELPVLPDVLGDVLRPGHDVLIDDGHVQLRVEETEHGRARCAVIVGGPVSSHKGVNIPGVPIPIPSLTEKDREDLDLALEVDVDFVALSFVRSAADVREMRALLEESGPLLHVIAKIEKAEAVDSLDEILQEADAVMVARGDLEYQVEAVEYMDRIARAVEPSLGYRHQIPEVEKQPTIGDAMSNAACDLAEAVGAKAILVPTFTGRTASAVARLRPRRPIIGLTHLRHSVQQMAVEWGVTPIEIPQCQDVEDLWSRSLDAARGSGIVESGDRVVITAGTAVNIPGSTNVIKVDTA